ncbi:MAG: flippase-like domain-containing protein, partial [Dehalococcoidia bacterium]|nr:flippase-like domain-containing protein [Dehalococcoidia bacterium]
DVYKRQILITTLIGIAIFAGLSIWGNISEVAVLMSRFPWGWLPGILFLTSINYLLRFLKWHYYLSVLNIRITKVDSALIFFSGLSFSVTPYKAGEVVKSFFLERACGEKTCRTVPIVLAERLTDVTGMVLLAAIGALNYSFGPYVVGATIAAIIVLLFLSQSPKMSMVIINAMGRFPVLRRYRNDLITLYQSSHELLGPKPTVLATFISTASWFFECLAAWLILSALNAGVSIFQATSTYAISSIAGAIVLLPGGLGATEASLVGMLVMSNVPNAVAACATFLIRISTLWYGVTLGMIVSGLLLRRWHFSPFSVSTVPELSNGK